MAKLLYEFLQEQSNPRPFLIGRGLLPVSGKVVLGGAPKANKSFIALNMGISLAKGEPIFKAMDSKGQPILPVSKKCRVLYFEQEIGEGGLRNRLNGILGGELDPAVEFFIKSRDMQMRLDTEDGRKLITKEVDEVRPDVIIFDPLAKFHLLDENSAQHMGAIMRAGDKLIEAFGTSIIYIHHTAKESPDPEMARRGGSRLRGSSAVFADVDTLILVDRQGASNAKEPVIKLEFEIRQDEPLDNIYVRRTKSGVCEYLPPHTRHRVVPAAEALPEAELEPDFVPKAMKGF